MHAVKVPSPGLANSALTCRNEHLRHNAFPPQQSASGTHYRYGPPTSSYTILDPEGSVPKLGTLVPVIGLAGHAQHMPSALDPRSSYIAHPRDITLSTVSFICSSYTKTTPQTVHTHSLLTIYWRSRWSRVVMRKGSCSLSLNRK